MSQQESKDSDNTRDDDIKHDKVENHWKIRLHESLIEDEEPSEPKLKALEPQLRKKKQSNLNLKYVNAVATEE